MAHRTFNFHGVGVEIRSENRDLLQQLEEEFSYFARKTAVADSFRLEVRERKKKPVWGPAVGGTRSRIFLGWKSRRVCFFGTQWVKYDYWGRWARVESTDLTHQFEALMLVVLSYVGERLDEQGWHRVHGFGFERNGKGTVVLARSGGGKSTLALQMLEDPTVRIFSDDTPLVNALGEMRSFPQRIALARRPGPEWKPFARFGHGTKYVLGSRLFADRIVESGSVEGFVVLERDGELSRADVLLLLARWLVVGHETPQIWELYLRFRPRDFIQKSRILFSRMRAAWNLARRCPAFGLMREKPREMQLRLLRRFYLEFVSL